MSATCVVQARLGSTRLPGKVLADLDGEPLLCFMLGRLRSLRVDAIVVATSTEPRDDAVADAAREAGVPVVRGSEHDVLNRFMTALDAHPATHVIRLTADCPLTDPEIVNATLEVHHHQGADYTSNVTPRTFPKGLDVEVATVAALRTAAAEARDPTEREHVMPFLYRHPERFRLASYRNDELLGEERWTVDTADDLSVVRRAVARLGGRRDFGWRDVLHVLGHQWQPPQGEPYLRPATRDDREWLRQLRNDPAVVRFSRVRQPVSRDEHEKWFGDRLDDPATRICIGELDGEAVGMVRIDVTAAVGEVSIALAPGQRGKGIGRALLTRLQGDLAQDFQVMALTAAVHEDNIPSRKVFEAAGFRAERVDDRFHWLRWDKAAG